MTAEPLRIPIDGLEILKSIVIEIRIPVVSLKKTKRNAPVAEVVEKVKEIMIVIAVKPEMIEEIETEIEAARAIVQETVSDQIAMIRSRMEVIAGLIVKILI
jgi:hypothetical protein